MWTTPSSTPFSSTTSTEVIFFSSIRRSAVAASSVRASVTGFLVRQSAARQIQHIFAGASASRGEGRRR